MKTFTVTEEQYQTITGCLENLADLPWWDIEEENREAVNDTLAAINGKDTGIDVLAKLEAFRINNPNDDYIIRSLSAVVASAFGYKNRAEWMDILRGEGLIEE